jgi:hypothetical protein
MTSASSTNTPINDLMPQTTNDIPGTYVCDRSMPGLTRIDVLALADDGTYQYESIGRTAGMAPEYRIETQPETLRKNSGHWLLVSPGHLDLEAGDGSDSSTFMSLLFAGDQLSATDVTDGRLVFERYRSPIQGPVQSDAANIKDP